MYNDLEHMYQIISLDIIQTIIKHSDNVFLLRVALTTKLRDLLSCKLTVFVQYSLFGKHQQILNIEYAANDLERVQLEQDIETIQPTLLTMMTCSYGKNPFESIESFSKYANVLTVPLINENQMLGSILLFDPSQLYNVELINTIMEKIQPYISIVIFNAISYSEMENIIFQRTKELNKAILQLNEASKAKSLFLANMSHEMRTPLNGIIGFSELLANKETDPLKREYLKKIDFASHTLLHLISEVLDLSRIEFDSFELYETAFDLQKTLEDIVSLHLPKAQFKGLSFHLQTKGIPKSTIVGDVERFKQIINNLLSNAIKFTAEGSVDLIIECEPYAIKFEDEVIETRLKFKGDVIDTGKGIHEKNLEKIFEIFSQEDQTTTREYGGSGLGLAIAQRLIHLMGGQIHVDSEVGRGSVFSFYVMFQYAPSDSSNKQATIVVEPEVTRTKQMSNLSMLVVEDNELNANLLFEIFKLYDLKADFVANGQEAVNAVQRKYYDLIFMDYQMPIMDGLLATQLIRQQNTQVNQPYIIALTASSSNVDRIRCIEAGMNDYITKPINIEVLLSKIEKYRMNRNYE
jgi:signal transduction histidine kinase/CheY-like chemotaxis protein